MNKKVTIVGTGYVGISNALLLAQHNEVVALDIIPKKVDMLNTRQSPIEDADVENYLKNKPLNFRATLDKQDAYSIVANRLSDEILDVKGKVMTRDLFDRDS